MSRESFVSAQIRSFWFRSKVSGGESRRVRAVAVSPMVKPSWCVRYQLGCLLGFPLRLWPGLVCLWLALNRSLVAVLGSVCVQVWCCGPRATLASPNKMWGLGGVAVVDSLPSWILGDGLAVELIGSEAFLAGPTALYGPWVQGVYTVTGCCVGGSNLQRSSPNDGIVGGEILFVLLEPCVSRFEGAFLSGSSAFLSGRSRRLVALSVIDSPSGPSGLRYSLVQSLLLRCFI
ncbi:hypothetical protein YC2023_084567 [Brassica napus]